MTTPYKILIGFLFAIILFLFFRSCTYERKWQKSEQRYSAFLDSLTSAVPKVDTIYLDSIVSTTQTIYRDTGRIVVDTVECPKQVITGKYDTDLLSVRWRITLFGELERVEILPGSSYRFREITITKTVVPPPRSDVMVQMNRERSHLYFVVDAGFYPDFANFGTGLIWIHKRGFGIQAKMYVSKKVTFGGGFVMRIK